MTKVNLNGKQIELSAEEADLITTTFDSISLFEKKFSSVMEETIILERLNDFMNLHLESIKGRKMLKEDYSATEKEKKSTIPVLKKAKEIHDSLVKLIGPFNMLLEYLLNTAIMREDSVTHLTNKLAVNANEAIKTANTLMETLAEFAFE